MATQHQTQTSNTSESGFLISPAMRYDLRCDAIKISRDAMRAMRCDPSGSDPNLPNSCWKYNMPNFHTSHCPPRAHSPVRITPTNQLRSENCSYLRRCNPTSFGLGALDGRAKFSRCGKGGGGGAAPTKLATFEMTSAGNG